MSVIAYYHHPCLDGLAAAYAAQKSGVPMVCPYKGQDIPVDGVDVVYFLDCAPPRAVYDKLTQVTKVVILDHHISNQRGYEGTGVTFDLTKSGCQLAWDHFIGSAYPELLRIIAERDLGNLKEYSLIGRALMNRNPTLSDLGDLIEEGVSAIDRLQEEGRVEQATIDAIPPPKRVTMGLYTVAVAQVDTHKYVSELGIRWGSDVDYVLMWQDKGDIQIYLRTTRDDVDVSLIAQRWGGGGHPKAAGASLTKEEFSLLKL